MPYELYLPETDAVLEHLGAIRNDGLLPYGTLYILVGDFHSFVKTAIFIDDVPAQPSLKGCVKVLENSLTVLSDVVTVHGTALAVSRAGEPEVSATDAVWRDAFATATATVSTVNHGVYVVTRTHVGRLGGPSSLAA